MGPTRDENGGAAVQTKYGDDASRGNVMFDVDFRTDRTVPLKIVLHM